MLREHGPRYWWEGPASAFVPPSRRYGLSDAQLEENWKKGTDTMDVWFDSGVAWSQLEELYASSDASAQAGKTVPRTFGADVCLEGTDQHRGWFQSLLLTALGSAPASSSRVRAAPYTTLVTHGMVLDEKGKKMSKSLGNIVSPMAVIHGEGHGSAGAGKGLNSGTGKGTSKKGKANEGYGSDVLRLWAATVEFWKDMTIGPTVLQQCAETMRKIRNSARFILGSLGDRPFEDKVDFADLALADRYVLHRLHRLENIARDAYVSYDYPKGEQTSI